MVRVRFLIAFLLGGLGLLAQLGCSRAEQIEHYTVLKPPPSEEPSAGGEAPADRGPVGEPKDRTLGAIIPHNDQGWFFKLTGPKDTVAAKADEFTKLVKSVRFSTDGKPQWTLPEGWQEQPGSGIRFATLLVPGEGQPLELTVISLPKTAGDEQGYLLANINRWRDQLKLPPITAEQLSDESSQLDLDGSHATLVNLVGIAAPNSMGRPPFFPGANNGK